MERLSWNFPVNFLRISLAVVCDFRYNRRCRDRMSVGLGGILLVYNNNRVLLLLNVLQLNGCRGVVAVRHSRGAICRHSFVDRCPATRNRLPIGF